MSALEHNRVGHWYRQLLRACYVDHHGARVSLLTVHRANLRSGGTAYPQDRYRQMLTTLYATAVRHAYQESLRTSQATLTTTTNSS